MDSRKRWVMVGLAALVAVTAVIVYARRGEQMATLPPATGSAGVTAQAETATPATPRESEIAKPAPAAKPPLEPLPAPQAAAPAPAPAPTQGGAPDVLYDLSELPPPVQRMLEEIVVAAQSGDIEQMRPVLESNELKPMVASSAVDDPIAFWKKASADSEGRDVLAALLNVLSSGYKRMQQGEEVMYVWPYFAETDLAALAPSQMVELYRVLPASQAVPMQRSGKYSYYRVGIAADGVWHYFLQ